MGNLVPVAIVTTVDGCEVGSAGVLIDLGVLWSAVQAEGGWFEGDRYVVVPEPHKRIEYVINPE